MKKTIYASVILVFQAYMWYADYIYINSIVSIEGFVLIPSVLLILIYDIIKKKLNVYTTAIIVLNIVIYITMMIMMSAAENQIINYVNQTNKYVQDECCKNKRCPEKIEDWTKVSSNNITTLSTQIHFKGGFKCNLVLNIHDNGQYYQLIYNYFYHKGGDFFGGVEKCKGK